MSEITVGTIGFPSPRTDRDGMSEFHGPTSSVAVFVEGLGCWHSGHTKAIEKALREVEEAHLLGTSAPYGPPKPPHEYKRGDRVEVWWRGVWYEATYAEYNGWSEYPIAVLMKPGDSLCWVERENIRPLEPSHD